MKRYKYFVGLMFVFLVLGVVSVYAAPLDIEIIEVFNVMAEMNESYETEYTMNITGFINITNSGSDDLSDIWLAVDLVNNASGLVLYHNGSSSNVYIYTDPAVAEAATDNVLNTTNADYFVHIPRLNVGETVSLWFDVNDTLFEVPILVKESYNLSKVPAKKIVSWRAYINVSRNENALSSDAWVWVNVTKYLSNDTANFGSSNWSFLNLSDPVNESGDPLEFVIWDAPYTSGAYDALNVTNSTKGIPLTPSDPNMNFSFAVSARSEVEARSSLEPFGFAVVFFEINKSFSGTNVVDVFATGPAAVQAIKEGPNETLWWNMSANVSNTAIGLAYVVTNLTLFAVNTTAGFPNMNEVIKYVDEYPNVVLNPGQYYNTGKYSFRSPIVPAVWANMTFRLIEDPTLGWQVVNYSVHEYDTSYGSKYIVVEKILVIGTYIVKVTKHVVPQSGNNYSVYLVVENIGGDTSPDLWVYDMLPRNFTELNWDNDWTDVGADGNWVNRSDMFIENITTSITFGDYYKGFAWHLRPLAAGSNGDGNYTDYSEIASNKSVVIYYEISGTGDYKLSEAFIVGIDPTFSMNVQTSPKITIVSGSAARSYESLFAALAVAMLLGAVVARSRR